MTSTLYAPLSYLDEVQDLASRLIDQIEWIGMVGGEDDNFARDASHHVDNPAVKASLKRLVAKSISVVKLSYEGRMLIDRQSVSAAARMVVWSLKQLFLHMGNSWIMKKRLIVQFSSIEVPWVEDLTRAQQIIIPE